MTRAVHQQDTEQTSDWGLVLVMYCVMLEARRAHAGSEDCTMNFPKQQVSR